MPNAYHNLAGWLRDVRKALAGGEELAYLTAEAIRELDDLIEAPDDGDPSLEDAESATESVCGADMDLPDPADGRPLGGPDAGHAAMQPADLARPSGLAAQVGARRAAFLARQAAGVGVPAGPLARASVTTARLLKHGKGS